MNRTDRLLAIIGLRFDYPEPSVINKAMAATDITITVTQPSACLRIRTDPGWIIVGGAGDQARPQRLEIHFEFGYAACLP